MFIVKLSKISYFDNFDKLFNALPADALATYDGRP